MSPTPPPTELNEALRKIRRKLLIGAAANVLLGGERLRLLADQTCRPLEISGVIYAVAARRKHLWKCDPSSVLMHLMMIYAASRGKKNKVQKRKKKRIKSSSPTSCRGCGKRPKKQTSGRHLYKLISKNVWRNNK